MEGSGSGSRNGLKGRLGRDIERVGERIEVSRRGNTAGLKKVQVAPKKHGITRGGEAVSEIRRNTVRANGS